MSQVRNHSNPKNSTNPIAIGSPFRQHPQKLKIPMKKILLFSLLFMGILSGKAQENKSTARPLTIPEYEKAKTFSVTDLDKDTYVKFENTYILDRYEAKKPYFITGDDSMRKRMDLYKLVAKDGMLDLGLMVFYTTEKGKVYKALMPNFLTDGKVWERYFEDIHSIEKTEKNFVLKLSYVLSKELGYQLYKGMNQGKDLSKDAGTYGSDICFPGTDEVAMADGSLKLLKDVKAGDVVITADINTGKSITVKVKALTEHEAKNYAITTLVLLDIKEQSTNEGTVVSLYSKALQATPNHPVETSKIIKSIGSIAVGEQIYCMDEATKTYHLFTVWNKTEQAGGTQKVFNIVAESGSTFIMNNVVVRQKL